MPSEGVASCLQLLCPPTPFNTLKRSILLQPARLDLLLAICSQGNLLVFGPNSNGTQSSLCVLKYVPAIDTSVSH